MYETASVTLQLLLQHIPEATYFIYKVALSILEPTVRLLIYRGVCIQVADQYLKVNGTIDNITDTSPCRDTLAPYPHLEDQVQSEAADYMIISKILMNVPAIILGFFCGGWSDLVGRRLPMFITCLGSCFAVFIYMMSLIVGGAAIPFILFGTFMHSVFGRNSVITMSVHSCVTDLTTKEDRTKRLGRLLAMNFLGQFCGSLILAATLDWLHFLTILGLVFVLFSCCCVLIAALLQETAPTSTPLMSGPLVVMQSSRELCKPHHMKDSVNVIARPRPNNLRLYLVICLVCLVVNQTCKAGEVDVTLLYVRHRPLDWEKSQYGLLLAVNYAGIGCSLLFVLPLLSSRLNINDTAIILGVVCFKIVRLILMSFARQSWMVFLSIMLDSPIGMVISCIKSIISKIVDESETGKAFAIQASIETASGMLGSVMFNSLYDISFRHFLGTTFLVEASVYLILLGIGIWMHRTVGERLKSMTYDRFKGDDDEGTLMNEEIYDDSNETNQLSVTNPFSAVPGDGGGHAFRSYGGTSTTPQINVQNQTPYQQGNNSSIYGWTDNTAPQHFTPVQSAGDSSALRNIAAPEASQQRQTPPASIARPRPTSSLVHKQGEGGSENDQFGALSNYR